MASPLDILVVDDDREICELLTEFLSDQGHRVVPAVSGSEAIRIIDQGTRTFALALVDWSMVGVSGRDVVDHLHRASPATAVFVSTGHSPDQVSHSHVGPYVSRILRKPFALRLLAKEIERVR